MTYYVQFPHSITGETIAGELESDKLLTDEELCDHIMQFALENGCCGAYALENTLYKVSD